MSLRKNLVCDAWIFPTLVNVIEIPITNTIYIYEMSVAVDNNILNSSIVLDQRFVFDNANHKKF